MSTGILRLIPFVPVICEQRLLELRYNIPNFTFTMKKTHTPSKVSRRKFLTRLGLATGVAAASPMLKPLAKLRGGLAMADAKSPRFKQTTSTRNHPAFLDNYKPLKPVGSLRRPA